MKKPEKPAPEKALERAAKEKPEERREAKDVAPRTALSTSLLLMLRARKGERTAAEELFGRLLPSLNRWARGKLPRWARRRADTGDLVQDALGAFLRRRPRIEPRRKQAIRLYLQESIRNRVRDEIRRAGKVEVSAVSHSRWPAGGRSPLERLLTTEDLRRYRAALKTLSTTDRQLIVGRIELEYSYEQLALVTEKPSADAARMATSRALVRLAKGMGAE